MTINRATGLIPRKNYFGVAPSFVRSKMLQQGIDPELAIPIANGLQGIFNKFAIDERLNYDVIEKNLGGTGSGETTKIIAASNTVLGARTADYTCDGTADEAEINQAIVDLRSTGGKILLLEGTYQIASSITTVSSHANEKIHFHGMGASTKLVGASGINILHVGHPDASPQGYWKISDILFSGGRIAIDTDIDGPYEIYGCFFETQTHDAIYIQDMGGGGAYIHNNRFLNTTTTVDRSCITIDNCSAVFIVENHFIGGGGTSSGVSGQVSVGGADQAMIIGNYFVGSLHHAIYGGSFSQVKIADNFILNPAVEGINLVSGSFDALDSNVENNFIQGCGTMGIHIQPTFGTMRDIKVSGNRVQDCQREGIYISNDSQDFMITDNFILDCGLATANTYSGIVLQGGVRASVMGNKIKGTSHKYSIDVPSHTDALVVNNDCKNGYTTAATHDLGTGTIFNLDGSANNWNRA